MWLWSCEPECNQLHCALLKRQRERRGGEREFCSSCPALSVKKAGIFWSLEMHSIVGESSGHSSPFLDDMSCKVVSPFVLLPCSPSTFQPQIQFPCPRTSWRGEKNILVTVKWPRYINWQPFDALDTARPLMQTLLKTLWQNWVSGPAKSRTRSRTVEMPPKSSSPKPTPRTPPWSWNGLRKAWALCLYHWRPLPTAPQEERLVGPPEVKVSETFQWSRGFRAQIARVKSLSLASGVPFEFCDICHNSLVSVPLSTNKRRNWSPTLWLRGPFPVQRLSEIRVVVPAPLQEAQSPSSRRGASEVCSLHSWLWAQVKVTTGWKEENSCHTRALKMEGKSLQRTGQAGPICTRPEILLWTPGGEGSGSQRWPDGRELACLLVPEESESPESIYTPLPSICHIPAVFLF